MLRPLAGAQQCALVQALDFAQAILDKPADDPMPSYILRRHQPGDMGWVVQAHGEIYCRDYGWHASFEALVARVAADFIDHFDPARERCWIAERDGRRVGSIFLVRKSASVAKLRLLLVMPEARGLGLGNRLVDECIAFARQAGYRQIVLWTNSILHAARHIYERAGFELTGEETGRQYGPEMTFQTWRLKL